MPDTMHVSVVIPVYNGERTLGACLHSLLHQSGFRGTLEIIVVDDASRDGSVALVERMAEQASGAVCIRLMQQPRNRGPAAARNRGAAAASGNIVLFTDADCEPEHDWVQQMTAPLADPDIAAVKGAYRTRQPELVARFAQAEFESRYRLLARLHYVDVVFTYAAAIRTNVFRAIGGFDAGFPVPDNEDTDLSYRLSSNGHKILFNPRAIVYHQHPRTLRRYLKVKFSRAYWRACVYRRYPGKAVTDSYTPQTLKLQIALVGLIGSGALAAPFTGSGIVISAIGLLAFAASVVPFAVGMREHRIDVRLAAPGIIFLRACTMALGLLSVVPRLLQKDRQTLLYSATEGRELSERQVK